MGSEPTGPTDIDALQRQLAELQAKLAAAQEAQAAGERGMSTGADIDTQTIATQGGAVVQGAVQVRNGHFIGRDFVQIVTHVTHAGEDPEEAKSVIALYLHALATDLAGLKLGEIDASADQTRQTPLQLADIYVPLDTTHSASRRTRHLRIGCRANRIASGTTWMQSARRGRFPPWRRWPSIAS